MSVSWLRPVAKLLKTTAGIGAALVVACSSDHRVDDGHSTDGEATCENFVSALSDCGVVIGTRLAGCVDDHPLLPCLRDCVVSASCQAIEAAYCDLATNAFTECVTGCQAGLPPPTFLCDDGAPIQASYRCDGASDCPNGEDEDCPSGTFTCDNGLNLPAGWQCDGVEDCAGGEDERDCIPGPPFTCDDGTTIPTSGQCDGVPDCANEEDELDCARLACE